MKTITNIIYLALALYAFACFTLLPAPKAFGVVPPPDGGYPGGNTAEGDGALLHVNTAIGINNTAVGFNALTADTTGQYNVAIGSGALANNTTGFQNMAIGADALASNIAGTFNMAIGFRALFMNTGSRNSAVGAAALRNNTTASDNTAIGSTAMKENTTGHSNTGIGSTALRENTIGKKNTANGAGALQSNTAGNQNTASGFQALNQNNGDANVAIGDDAMINATLAFSNTVVGSAAGTNIVTGVSDTYIGAFVDPAADENFTVRIADNLNSIPGSACFIGGVTGNMGANFTSSVVLDPLTGQLGEMPSSARFKKDIDPMGNTSEAIFSLRPVTFHYMNDKTNTPQFGLIAEDVAKVNPALIGVDKEGKPHSVRYDDINAMLLNEFLKEHRKVEQLEKQVEKLTAGLQKVSAQLELSKAAPQTVRNNN